VSAMPRVREALVDLQRSFAATVPGAVLDGRDIGTVICPHAEVKIYVDAAPEVRARRRATELRSKGVTVDEAKILDEIRRRDERDRTRSVAPLKPAADAHLLDTTYLDIDAAVRAAIDIVEAARAGFGALVAPFALGSRVSNTGPARVAAVRPRQPDERTSSRPFG
jgi:CMP/dCMP kinase